MITSIINDDISIKPTNQSINRTNKPIRQTSKHTTNPAQCFHTCSQGSHPAWAIVYKT